MNMDGNFNNNQYGQPQGQPVPPQGQPVNPYASGINYGAPVQPVNSANLEPVSIGTWVGIILLSCIPCVNIIMLFVWAFGDGKESRKNWAKAQLIWVAIGIILSIIFYAILGATMWAAFQNMNY